MAIWQAHVDVHLPWDERLPSDYPERLGRLLPPGPAWDPSQELWGEPDGDCLEVWWRSELSARFDMRRPRTDLHAAFAHLVEATGGSFGIPDRLGTMPATTEALHSALEETAAARFARDPRGFLDGVERPVPAPGFQFLPLNLLQQALSLLSNAVLASRYRTPARFGDPARDTPIKILDVPGSTDRILLLRPQREQRPQRNLLRCRADGRVVWHAHLPIDVFGSHAGEAADAYADAAVQDWLGAAWLSAWSGSSYLVTIDLRSGRLMSSQFTK
jgi:hypothetical protein